MANKGSKTLIGAFVLGALALLTAGIVLVGSGTLFSRNVEFVLFFESSLRGLVPGSPVFFNGIRVGKVKTIHIDAAPNLAFSSPVYIEVQSDLIIGSLDSQGEKADLDDASFVSALIAKGLRASLGTASIVTGQLTVELEMRENATPPRQDQMQPYEEVPQIPTVTSTLDSFVQQVSHLPVAEIAATALLLLQNLNANLEAANLPKLVAQVGQVAETANNSMASLGPLLEQMQQTLARWDTVAQNTNATVGDVRSFLREGLPTLQASLTEARGALKNANSVMAKANGLVSEDSATMLELAQALRAITEAAQAVGNLATLIELQPDSLLFGRTNSR